MRILLAVDGSKAADQARDLVAALPWRQGGLVRIVSVAPTRGEILGVPWSAAIPNGADEIEGAVLRMHRDTIEAAEREIRSARSDLRIEPVLARGRPGSIIVDLAREMDADLVVVGHRGMGTLESMLLGSVSSEVVDHAPCPVLVARCEHLGPVILADDGSPYARTAEAAVSAWPIFTGLPVTVVTVAEDAYPDALALTTTECEAAVSRLRDTGIDASAKVRAGDAAHQVIACARERDAGLIVVGTRGQTGLRRLLLGSVARNIVLHAPCSVLVVREGARLDGRRIEPRTEERELVGAFG